VSDSTVDEVSLAAGSFRRQRQQQIWEKLLLARWLVDALPYRLEERRQQQLHHDVAKLWLLGEPPRLGQARLLEPRLVAFLDCLVQLVRNVAAMGKTLSVSLSVG